MLKKNYLVVFSTLALLLLGSIMLLQNSATIFLTSVKLLTVRDNISYYNEAYRKTDSMTEDVLKEYEKREELYNSEDSTVRWFCNLPTLAKALVAIVAFLSFLAVPFLYLINILDAIRYFKWRKRKAQKHRATAKQ